MRTALMLSTLILLPVAAYAQPAVPAVPPAAAPRAAAPAATVPAPAPAPAARAPSADDPPTSDGAVAARPATPVSSVPSTSAASAVPPTAAPSSAAPTASASAAPPTSAPPITTASAAPPTTEAPPTTAPAVPAAGEGAPDPATIQTITRNHPLTPEGNAAFLAAYAARSDVRKLPGGTMYRVLFNGTGKAKPLGRTDTVTVSYRGWMIDGTSFDASPVGSPRTFQVGALIPGWREALLQMKEGDLWEVVVPSDQAYGAEGRAGRIPPNQTLVFVVSLAHVAFAG